MNTEDQAPQEAQEPAVPTLSEALEMSEADGDGIVYLLSGGSTAGEGDQFFTAVSGSPEQLSEMICQCLRSVPLPVAAQISEDLRAQVTAQAMDFITTMNAPEEVAQ